ncbi:leucine-rich repeat domain-containing protein [Emticicia sp. 21SJ11W-3]|uniref:leucine-rich repeat domain-containing protein n=1 Tax=Emticicia sp. 21SJ11W-3 TaxID=2916755 RepID=UPI00209E7719|nr:leucine-rich repeat domain-containing protein [Emticicia sp. 21SJ11W-3]UTA66520.1 leucine-rich repeat domain-containing protein [Emticicia sp. 21SJ11W-3]
MSRLAIELIEENIRTKNPFLDLGNCGLVGELPNEILKCKDWLERLNLGVYYFDPESKISIPSKNKGNRNKIKGKGLDALQNLPQLQSLDLHYNQIQDISFLQNLSQLQSLDLSSNQIQDISFLQNLSQLQSLDISINQIQDIRFLQNLSQLQSLDLSSNQMQDISFLQNLSQLQSLDLSFNQIQNYSFLQNLSQLQSLDLRSNQIQDYSFLQNLSQLQSLDLRYNQIKDISFLQNLYQLLSLYLSSNQIQDIRFLQNLSQLQSLDLSSNQIHDVSFLQNLTRLSFIDIRYNPVQNIGEGFKQFILNNTNLEEFYSDPLPGIPAGIEKGIDALRTYFKELKKQAERHPNRSFKIILMGNTRAGKSQLLNYLVRQSFDDPSISTHGIKIEEWQTSINNDAYNITFYDFGGQDFYHATHNLYLSHKALYLTLWNTENEQSNSEQNLHLGYWLGNILFYLLSDTEADTAQQLMQSHVWCIQSKADLQENQRKLLQSQLDYQVSPNGNFYLSIKNAFDADAYWQKEWQYFKDHLLAQIAGLCKQADLLTASMVAIKEKVLKTYRNKELLVVKYDDLLNDCRANTGASDEQIYNALLVWDAAGYIQYYPKDAVLKNYIFPNPALLSETVFGVLENKKMETKGGEFMQADIDEVLNKQEIETQDLFSKIFIDLLLNFEIIFEKPGQPGTYVVPQYLPPQKLETFLLDIIPVTLVIRFKDYMPFWRISNFITQVGALPASNAHYWRYGILYKLQDCTVLIRMQRAFGAESTENQKVMIHIDGPADIRSKHLREVFEFFTLTEKRIQLSFAKPALDLLSEEVQPKRQKSFIERIELSDDGHQFFNVAELLNHIDDTKYCKNQDGKIKPIPPIFYPVLNKENKTPKRIFFSYAHADAVYRKQLETHFAALKRDKLVETWFDLEISPGEEWDKRIMEEIQRADIVLALISPDYINSYYIWEKEIPNITPDKTLIPIFLRYCDVPESLNKYQGAPFDSESKDKKAGIKWILSDHWKFIDEAYLEVVKKVKSVLGAGS